MKFVCIYAVLGMFVSLATAGNITTDGEAGGFALASLASSR